MANQSGQTKITSKWWFWVIIVVWVFIVGGIYNATKKPEEGKNGEVAEIIEKNDAENKAETDEANKKPQLDDYSEDDEQFKYYLGQQIVTKGLRITVTSVERNYQAKYATPKSGKEFIKVNISLENMVKVNRSYNAFYWKIEDSNGDINDYTEAMLAQADDSMDSGELAPDGTKNCSIVFSVPSGDTELKVYYNPDILSDDNGTIIVLKEMDLS